MSNIAIIYGKQRFTNTEKWKSQLFMELSPELKLAYLYIMDNCDNVGVWQSNTRLADFTIGATVDWEEFKKIFEEHELYILDNGSWWFPHFIYFQYKELKQASKPHKSYIDLLIKHNLYDIYKDFEQRVIKGLAYPIQRLKEKEKEKDKEKEKEKDIYKEKEKDKDEDLTALIEKDDLPF